MLQANELRIGNYINFHSKVFQVTGIKDNWVYCCKNSYPENSFPDTAAGLQPIPLTPELLEKCGFLCMNKVPMYFKKYINEVDARNIQLSLSEIGINPDWIVGYHNDGTYMRLIKIIYLHQLQNLYFALTGEELEVKL